MNRDPAHTCSGASVPDARDPSTAPTGASDGIAHRFVHANGIQVHCTTCGAPGQPLVLLLHGFPECCYSFRHQLRGMSSGHYCVAPDLRGYGDTDKPPRGYDLDNLALDVVELVRALGYERGTIVGHDWGGAITWHVAERHSEVVERFCVINCPPADVLARAVLSHPRQLARSAYMLWFQLPWLAEHLLTKNHGRAISGILKHWSAPAHRFSDEELDYFRAAFCKGNTATRALSYYRQGMRRLFHPRALYSLFTQPPQKITRPGLLIWGAHDRALGVELTTGLERRVAAPLIKEVLADAGHFTQQEQPARVNQLLLEFMGSY